MFLIDFLVSAKAKEVFLQQNDVALLDLCSGLLARNSIVDSSQQLSSKRLRSSPIFNITVAFYFKFCGSKLS